MGSKGKKASDDSLIHGWSEWWKERSDLKKIGIIIAILFVFFFVLGLTSISSTQSNTISGPVYSQGTPDTTDNTTETSTTTTTQNGGQEDKAVSTVKNYGNGWTTIEQALESTTQASEESGNYISGGTWTTEAIDSSNYKVIYNVQENGETVEAIFKVDLDTGMVTGMNKLG